MLVVIALVVENNGKSYKQQLQSNYRKIKGYEMCVNTLILVHVIFYYRPNLKKIVNC
jgi:hypothetical protein